VVCGLLKGRGLENVAGERAVVGVSTAGGCGREVRDAEGADEWGREAERALTRRETVPTDRPHRAARERERGRAGWRRQAGPACQAPTAL
jgi:hypothetical protein